MKFHASARKCFKIIRKRSSKIHGLSTDRVAESQPIRVESLSFYAAVIRVVQIIARKGMTDVAHMNPDLMCASCFQLQQYKRLGTVIIQSAVMCYCTFPVSKIDLPQDCRITGSCNRCIDRAAFWDFSCGNGKILTVNLPFCAHL